MEYHPHQVVYDEFGGAYFITYNTTRPGYLSIEIEARDKVVRGSPFVTVVNGAEITAQTVCAAGVGTQVRAQTGFFFYDVGNPASGGWTSCGRRRRAGLNLSEIPQEAKSLMNNVINIRARDVKGFEVYNDLLIIDGLSVTATDETGVTAQSVFLEPVNGLPGRYRLNYFPTKAGTFT